MPPELDGTRCLLTAASKGLGRAAAEALVAGGATVVITSRSETNLAAARESICNVTGVEKGRVQTTVCDLADEDGIVTAVETAVELLGGLDVLVTNHGGPSVQPIAETSVSEFDAVYERVLRSTFLTLKTALPHLTADDGGSIVNIVSATAAEPKAGDVFQASLRPGIYGLSKSLANEYGPDGVRVNCVRPRGIMTDRLVEKIEYLAEKEGVSVAEAEAMRSAELPVRRLGEPGELGDAVAFLASDESSYITGETLALDGGWSRGAFP